MPKSKKTYSIGIDIGGTNIKAVLFDSEKVIADYSLATPRDDLGKFMIMLNALIEPLEEKARDDKVKIKGIGLGVAGVLDSKRRQVLNSPNLPLINKENIADKLEEKIGIPVVMDNDVNCFIRSEAKLGAGKKFNNIYGFTVGTGIGGGWWINDNVYYGATGGGGEPGEMIIDFGDEIGLEEAYHKLTQGNPANLAEEAYRGDVLAEKTFVEVGNILGLALANIVNLIDPEVIIVGGGVVESSDLFLSKVKKVMRQHIESSETRKKIKLLKSKLGEHAGAIGAAMLIA